MCRVEGSDRVFDVLLVLAMAQSESTRTLLASEPIFTVLSLFVARPQVSVVLYARAASWRKRQKKMGDKIAERSQTSPSSLSGLP